MAVKKVFQMASFRKRGDKWLAEVKIDGARKGKSFTTKKQAQNWATQTEYELTNLKAGTSLTHTLHDVFDRYGKEVSSTKRGYRNELKRLTAINAEMGEIKLIDLSREHFEQWIEERLKYVKSSTINRYLNLISNTMTYARRWRWMTHNPMADLKRPKDPPPRERRVSDDEIEQLLIALGYDEQAQVVTRRQRIAVALLFSLETAMRSGEVCKLRDENVFLDKRYVFLSEKMTKTATRRNVPLSSRAVELLEKLQPWQETVFNLTDIDRDVYFRKALNLTLITDMTWHDLRHEATWRLSQKLDVMDLARVTGHKDLKMLLRYYNPTVEELAAKLS